MESQYDIFEKEIAPLLEKLNSKEFPDVEIWYEIWDTIHHQGDVLVSSYIAVPKIFEIYEKKRWLDYNLPGLFAVIENCRQQEKNPKLPNWLEKEYFQSLEKTVQYCAENISREWDRDMLISFLQLTCVIKQNQGIYQLLDVASSSKYDEEFLLELYNKS